MDARFAIDLSCRFAAIGVMLGALEQWTVRDQMTTGGLLGMLPDRASVWRTHITALETVTLLVAVQVVTSLLVVSFGIRSLTGWIALCFLTISFVSLRWYRTAGGDGAEQMAAIVLISGVAAAPGWPGEARVTIAVLFVAAQIVLAYATSGIAKLISPVWRDGSGLTGILSTVQHGTPRLGRWLWTHRSIAITLSWSVMVWESTFPFLMVCPEPVVLLVLACGLMFHLSCAALMGLNGFIWSFPATYPCVLVASQMVRHWIHSW